MDKDAVVRKFRTTAADGKNYQVQYYNLDVIIALSYRVQSPIAVRFRRWATRLLHEYIQKGFTMDDERLKQGGNIERFPEDFMFQLTKGEFDIWKSQNATSNIVKNQEDTFLISQIVTSNLTDNQHDGVLISQIATSKPVERRGGTQKRPYAFTENGVAMLSSRKKRKKIQND